MGAHAQGISTVEAIVGCMRSRFPLCRGFGLLLASVFPFLQDVKYEKRFHLMQVVGDLNSS